ncbi:hypothetical protein MycrhDRAFT_3270 [Mycolicibacterium rhodesiae JS60]|nr:hypothetical protein MycrhDRAFT_3270 [Mycolicibacterium rhodesiae JS60]
MASLSSVRIPRDAVPVLKRIVELGDTDADALVSALSTGEVRDMAMLKSAVKSAVGHAWPDDDDIDSFVSHLMSMSTLGTSHDFTAPKLAAVITERISTSIDEGQRDVLTSRLSSLLAARDFQAFSKAIDIATEYDQVLHFARIISDIRPVFDTDVAAEPVGAVIEHTLRIDYFHEGRVKTTSFAMNEHDLKQLKDLVLRAEKKQKTLSNMLERLNLPEFNMTGDLDGDE